MNTLKSEDFILSGETGPKKEKIPVIIASFLEKLPPLTQVSLGELYKLVNDGSKQPNVRAALYSMSVGTPVSERNKPKVYYAIRLELVGKEVFLALPGVPAEELRKDKLSTERTDQIIQRLCSDYGSETIAYWMQSAQHRSVVQAASGMRAAKKRDNKTCLLCTIEGQTNNKSVSACHIISRRTLFWEALDKVEKMKKSIFTDDSVRVLKDLLKRSDRHSNSQFIVTLCLEHDNLLQDAFDGSIKRTVKTKPSTLLAARHHEVL